MEKFYLNTIKNYPVLKKIAHIIYGVFPLTLQGTITILISATCLKVFGYGSMDLVVFSLAICAIAILMFCLFCVIIGGLIAENAIENRKFVPILSELPWIGKMFQSTSIDKEQRELLIFITPNVVG